MNKIVLTFLVVGLTATIANGAYLSMYFTDGSAVTTAMPGESVMVDVVWDFTPDLGNGNNDLAGVIFQMAYANASLVGQSTTLPGWSTTGSSGPLGGSHQFASCADIGSQIEGPGRFVVGTMEIAVDPGAVYGDTIELIFQHLSVLLPSSPAGIGYAYPDKAENLFKAASYSGMYAYGVGSPTVWGCKCDPVQYANPLVINVIPEPGSLALLVLGGIVALRRS